MVHINENYLFMINIYIKHNHKQGKQNVRQKFQYEQLATLLQNAVVQIMLEIFNIIGILTG